MAEVIELGDEIGPVKVVHVREPALGLKAALVIDNLARGPAIGGLRFAPDVSVEECSRLARAMTLKNSAAGLPHGGGKSVLWGDPRMPTDRKASLIRAFAHVLRNETDYIFGPDMGTDEICMAWIKDEIGRATGLPSALGGIPVDELGATGWGLFHCAQAAARFLGIRLDGARVAIQGFGAVGRHAARFLTDKGARLVAASDTKGTIANERGIDAAALIGLKNEGRTVCDYREGRKLDRDAVIDVECDIWIPAARPDVIREDNVHRLRTKLVVQGANIPFTAEAERILHEKGVLVVPDFIANAGGVICAAMEYRGATQTAAFQAIEERIRANTETVLERLKQDGIAPRAVAENLALDGVRAAMKTRRFGIM
jgi:glutamate dehydrogenase (NAD(P)+)